ncbi:MAG TPA: translation initiation factor IF-2 [Alphaproteobacteria bacterium]|jgi:translation initiation factor IF-2|nr:translation initiation factor IF-2 [Alphaproteobacteria bacterium]MDP7164195.1 translation initiation factor IF-2 [Alphaproteobacteria bacterium]MDP7426741.1 translation initiation factor IF-2 [Alphaproteobacteria bacterium]HJM49963.1 translation initiation factor IF-2 [Alphaproteobacteria bacterium]
MSESKETEQSDERKSLSLARPGRLELKKKVEYGQVRQSFSRGRTKAVAVEVRKKRSVGREAPVASPALVEAPPVEIKPAPLEVVAEVREEFLDESGSGRGRVVLKSLTEDEKAARAKALEGAKAADEAARARAEDEARVQAEEDVRRAQEHEAADQRAAEEEERKRLEADARRKAEETARQKLDAPDPEAAGSEPGKTVETEAREGERDGLRRPRPDTKRQPGRRGPQRRRGGKMTVSDALSDRDERMRSLASVRRARERERKAARGGGGLETQKIIRDVIIPETIVVQELANRMAERGVDVIRTLMKLGVMANVNQTIDGDTAELVTTEFGHKVRRVSESDIEFGLKGDADEAGVLQLRAPVVTVMGHVDHGKTSLLDALRETDVAGGEAGGITQHIGAYQVELSGGDKITFLDTPGHEAFSAMRARGATVTDTVVLVVAADDGIMPQTVEAINHAKEADSPIIVAINKMDKPEADPGRVRQELLNHELVVEELGGDILCIELSAKERTNLDKLEEAILLQSEVLELRANPDRAAEGVIIEAKIDRGRGPVATILVQRGTLAVGDVFVAGGEWGRVRALVDDHGTNVETAGPSVPVEVLGLTGAPEAGDEFSVVDSEQRAREVAEFRQRRSRAMKVAKPELGTLEEMFERISSGETKEFPLVIKADVQGSLEAIVGGLEKMSTDEVKARILHGGVGGINESDVTLAQASGALVIGFNVRANAQARELARREAVEIRYYSVIYDVTNDVKAVLSGMLAPAIKENFLGNAEVLQTFGITKVGRVAGCLVTEGTVKKGAGVRLLRDNVVIHEGSLSQLKRFKDDVAEVRAGLECGIQFENYQDVQDGDVVEAFELEEVARTL